LERERRTLFLDGPNDVDWIFRNRILQDREDVFYVDYVESDGKRVWVEPTPPIVLGKRFVEPPSCSLATRLSDAGFDSPEALKVIAEIWRGVGFVPESHWQECHNRNLETLEALNDKTLLTAEGVDNAANIAWDWLFPLQAVDLSPI